MRYSVLFLLAVSIFCKPNVDRSLFPYFFSFLNSKKKSDTLSVTYSPNTFSLSHNIAINPITPTVVGTIQSCFLSAFPAGLSIDNACRIIGTPTSVQPEVNYIVTATNATQTATASLKLSVITLAPTISYAGSPYSFPINSLVITVSPTVSGTLSNFSILPTLPTGLILNTTTGQISGTPTVLSSAATYTVTASNADGIATNSFSLAVVEVPPSALSYAGNPFTFTKNTSVGTINPTVTGTVTGCNASPTLPTGLSISATCVITGTPTALQTTGVNYTITASNTGGSTTANINITINDVAPSALSYAGTPFTFTEYQAITTATPTSSGGAITNCTSAPGLPAGLSLNTSTCAISGTPTTVQGATAYTITASNSGGSTTANINITVIAYPNKRIFVTSAGYLPGVQFTTPTTADTLCNSDVGKPLGTGTYKAMIVSPLVRVACTLGNCLLSGLLEHIDWVFVANTTYYQNDGVTVIAMTNGNGLMPAGFTNSVNPAHSKYWTGLNNNWTTSSDHCSSWGSTATNSSCGGSGPNNSAASFTDNWGVVNCSGAQQLLCVQQ